MLMGLIKVTTHRDRRLDCHPSWRHVTACLLFRLLIEANDVSYCIHAPIHLCLFPSLSHHLWGHLASVISSCNESSRARHRLKMILVILIRALILTKLHSVRAEMKLATTKVWRN